MATYAEGRRRRLFGRELSFRQNATTHFRETVWSALAATRSRGHLCPVLNGAIYLVCENILSICNRASGLPESSRCALAADAMEDFASIRCTPSSPPEARRAPNPRRFPLMSRTPLSCFPGVPISSSKIASKYLLSQCSLAWVASLLPHVWQAQFSAALPLFCTKESSDCP